MLMTNKKLLGIITALLTIFGTIIPLDISAYFHPEAALFMVGGIMSYVRFSGFRPKELGVSVAYSMHPLLYGYIIKFFSRAFES